MNVDTLIFDFDGTIVDSLPVFKECVKELGPEFGYTMPEGVASFRDIDGRDLLTKDLGLSEEQFPRWMERFNLLLSCRMSDATPFEGIKDAMDKLTRLFRVGVITSNSEKIVRSILDREGIGAIGFIVSDAPIMQKEKAIEQALRRHGLTKEQVIYIGDEVRDIAACRKTGIRIIAVSWGFNSREILSRHMPDHIVETPAQLLELLTSHAWGGVSFPQNSQHTD